MKLPTLTLALLVLPSLVACNSSHAPETSAFAELTGLVAVLQPTAGSTANGTVTFTAVSDGVQVDFDVSGLGQGATHAVHVHEFGDLRSTDGKSLGGHYNPEQHDHGLPVTAGRHAGDLGNLEADATGRASSSITVKNMSLAGLNNPVIGRGVVVHAMADDGGQPTGNAGSRAAIGVIGVAKP
ncbi:MAG: Cu-Zn family superoxide dismutase [Pseudohongiellaceae bacterium]|jgi:Cu-Zn family superoxide dismutase